MKRITSFSPAYMSSTPLSPVQFWIARPSRFWLSCVQPSARAARSAIASIVRDPISFLLAAGAAGGEVAGRAQLRPQSALEVPDEGVAVLPAVDRDPGGDRGRPRRAARGRLRPDAPRPVGAGDPGRRARLRLDIVHLAPLPTPGTHALVYPRAARPVR